MQIKLSYKLFGAFFLILVIVVCAMALSRYLFLINFENYIHQMELQKLEQLVPTLKKEYLTHKGWENIKNNKKRWHRLLKMEMDGRQAGPPPEDVPPPRKPDSTGPPPPPGEPPPSANDGPPGGPMDLLLLDSERQPIIGSPLPNEQKLMVPINIDGRIVGWLGHQKPSSVKTGPPAMLLRRQTRHSDIIGSIVIALTGLIAFLLTRHLLKPIKRLTKGTQELANRNFSVRINAVTRDELGQLAKNFNTMAQTLESYESLRQKWLTDISHELRTPLAVLRGEIEALQDGLRKPTLDNLASLHAEILRITKLVEDLHVTSIADSERLYLTKEKICPLDILESIIESHQSRFSNREINIKLDPGNLRNASIEGDADRLGQVFTNIFENAYKYMRAPGVLQISGKATRDDVTLYVQDTGPGVPEEALPRLFDRLYRVETSRSRDSGGSGLGLSICRHIIEHHGGRIWAEKSALGGLAIVIVLPGQS